jgi:hypothetical protein
VTLRVRNVGYKLHATEPIFATSSGKMTKYKHLGKGGSPAHLEALIQVTRRAQIEALQRTLAALYQCWSDLYDNSGSQNKRTARKSGSRPSDSRKSHAN